MHEWHVPERFDVLIKDQIYEIKLVSRIPKRGGGKNSDGFTCPETHEIFIRKTLSAEEVLETLIHEYIHAIELEYDIDIPHDLIYQLEIPIRRLLLDNYL